MSGLEITSDARETIKAKLRAHFDGKIVRKDLTKKIKEGANVPIYVLEFLLGQYCSSDDDAIIETGVQQVKRILADNFVRPDESQKILSQLRKRGSHTVIDMITVQLDIQKNRYFAQFSNLGAKSRSDKSNPASRPPPHRKCYHIHLHNHPVGGSLPVPAGICQQKYRFRHPARPDIPKPRDTAACHKVYYYIYNH